MLIFYNVNHSQVDIIYASARDRGNDYELVETAWLEACSRVFPNYTRPLVINAVTESGDDIDEGGVSDATDEFNIYESDPESL